MCRATENFEVIEDCMCLFPQKGSCSLTCRCSQAASHQCLEEPVVTEARAVTDERKSPAAASILQ